MIAGSVHRSGFPTPTAFLERYRTQAWTIFFASLACWFAVSWIRLVQRVVRYYNPLPTWDYWRIIQDASLFKTRGWAVFLSPHNEHRIIFPELVCQLDLLFKGRLILPIVASISCYFSIWILLSWVIPRDRTISAQSRGFAVLLSGIILGWPGAAVVIGDPFLLQWTLSSACAVASIACVGRLGAGVRSVYLAMAMFAAFVATYSSANGLTLWPILLLEAWYLRLSRRQLVTIAVAGVFSIALYFVGYHADGKLDLRAMLLHPLITGGFLASYMSMPFGANVSNRCAICVGLISILVVAVAGVYAIRSKVLLHKTPVTLFFVYLFVLLTAALTAAGRMNASGDFADAKVSRYLVIQLIGWAVCGLLCCYFAAQVRVSRQAKHLFTAALLVCLGLGVLTARPTLSYDDNQFATVQMSTLGIENGLKDGGLTRRIFPSAPFVFELLPYLQAHQLSIYSLAESNWLGQPASILGRIGNEPRWGMVVSATPVTGGLEVTGWTEPDGKGRERIVLLNEDNMIVGFGRRLSAGFPSDLRTLQIPAAEGWVAFVNRTYPARVVTAYFMNRDQLQPIGGSIPLDGKLEREPRQAGALLKDLTWKEDGTWRLGGIPKLVYLDEIPRGLVYGSWSGANAKHGQIESSEFQRPAAGCVLLPVIHGEYVPGLSVEVVNADTGEVIESIPMQEGDLGWQFWRIKLDDSAPHLRFEAKDAATDAGEWLGIAQPSTCDAR